MIRKLKTDEIECRPAQIKANGFSLLLYKTARVDRAILTEEYGNHWQNDFKVIDGKMYGGIAVYDSELKQWLWRWDCGTESAAEKEKGEASDCFKRAGFKWGIGIELYSAPFIWINGGTVKDEFASKKAGKDVYKLVNAFEKFDVKEISYKPNGEINNLIIINSKKETVYSRFNAEQNKIETPPAQKNSAKPQTASKDEAVKEPALEDMDVFEGAKACSSYEELAKYYKDNFKSLQEASKKPFNDLIKELKRKFANAEAAQIY